MILAQKELEARIEIIRSIAKSQQALARILDSIADVSEHSPELAKLIRDNVTSLTAMQLTLTETMAGVRMRRSKYKGNPREPWMKSGIYTPRGSRREAVKR